MRRWTRILAACAFGACGPRPAANWSSGEVTIHTSLAEDEAPPPYPRAELQKAIAAEREAVAHADEEIRDAETKVGDDDHLRIALANAAVRRRFLQTLEVCAATSRLCPPRLDERPWSYAVDSDTHPALDTPLRFDLDSWRKVADELRGRACTCRTIDCVDSAEAAIAHLEIRPMPEVQADETASASVTGARDCLMRLRGRTKLPTVAAE